MKIIDPNDDQTTPMRSDGKPMVTFEVKMRQDPTVGLQKAVFIGGELMDWSVDIQSLAEARAMGPKFFRAAQRDIEQHYVNSVSEFIGSKVTATDIKKAIKNGWI